MQAKNQPTITDGALSHKKVGCPYIRRNHEATPRQPHLRLYTTVSCVVILKSSMQRRTAHTNEKQQINASAGAVILHLQNKYELKSVTGYVSFHRRDKCKNLLTDFTFIYILFLQCNINLVTISCL
jgi:hypothetical protein